MRPIQAILTWLVIGGFFALPLLASVVLLGVGIVFKIFGIEKWTLFLATGSILLIYVLLFCKKSLVKVQQQERGVVERFGEFNRVLQPGLQWKWPWIESIRAWVAIWEQPIRLFPENPRIDFKEGGTARLVEPTVWVRVARQREGQRGERAIEESVRRMIYEVANWRDAVREEIETALRAYLGTLTVEEAFDRVQEGNWWRNVVQQPQFSHLPEVFDAWGIEVTKITISDFDWSEEVVRARRQVFEAQRRIREQEYEAEAAKFEAIREALTSGGVHGKIVQILRDDFGYSPEEAQKVATELVKYFKGAKEKVIVDWRSEGGINLPELIAQVMKAIEKARSVGR